MRVTLIERTENAVELLIFTKNTRLRMAPAGLEEIKGWSEEKKLAELEYMSTTIPSSWEFCSLTFVIEGVSRAFTHQLVRTRTASYAQQAMRIVDMTGFDYYMGPSFKDKDDAKFHYEDIMQLISDAYENIIKDGVKPEDARGVLPTNILTNICMKINLRNFADLVRKRFSPRVQDEYADVLRAMVEVVLNEWPWAKMFIMPKAMEAHKELNLFLQRLLDEEIKMTGKPQNETETWKQMKNLDLIRNDM